MRSLLTEDSSDVFVSLVSAWELTIKASLGKLPLPCRIEEFFSGLTRDLRAQVMGLDLKYVARLADLPAHHADPFDRLIVAQALVDGCAVITSDRRFGSYGVNVVW